MKAKMEKPIRGLDRNKKIFVAAAIVIILIVIVGLQPRSEKPVIASQTNTEVFSALLKGGITSSNTVEEGDTVKVTYQLPEGLEKEKAELYILGVLSILTPNKQKAVVLTFSGEKKIGGVEVLMEDVFKYKNKEITIEEFKGKIKRL